jgi:hypothetical protein
MAPFRRTTPKAHEKYPTAGRPSEYKPEYCQRIIDYMAKGHSLTAFAGSIDVDKATVYRWINQHPEFSEAADRAKAKQVCPWEEKLIRAEKGGEVAASIFALKNAAPDEWREVRYASFDTTVRVETLTDEQLEAIAAGHRAADVGAIDVQYNRLLEKPKRYTGPREK